MKATHAFFRQFHRRFSSLSAIVIGAASALGLSATADTGTWSGAPTGTWDTSATNWSGVSGTPWEVENGPNNDAPFHTGSLNATVNKAVRLVERL